MKPRPDLAIEVVWTSGGIDKLVVWQRLDVPEVWFWENHEITVYVLQSSGYIKFARSPRFPGLDVVALEALIHVSTLNEAVAKMQELARAV